MGDSSYGCTAGRGQVSSGLAMAGGDHEEDEEGNAVTTPPLSNLLHPLRRRRSQRRSHSPGVTQPSPVQYSTIPARTKGCSAGWTTMRSHTGGHRVRPRGDDPAR